MPLTRKARAVTALAPDPGSGLLRAALRSLACCLAFAGAAEASGDGPVFDVSRFAVEYGATAANLPEITSLVPVEVELGRSASGWVDPASAQAGEKQTLRIGDGSNAGNYHASAIAAISRGLLERIRAEGFIGVFVKPHASDIDVHTENDLRPYESGPIRLLVEVGRVRELRSVASGDRIDEAWKINNPAHREIRLRSPIQPSSLVRPETSDVIRKRDLEDYLFRVNRYPGRRVEAALAGSRDGDGIALDLHVHEAKPWFVYFQSSDTGTKRTEEWQNLFGYVNRQATDNDDIFSVQYTNAGGAELNALSASYEAPWFDAERPDWLKSQADEAWWQTALLRDWIPWWGSNRIRWGLAAEYNSYQAADVSGIDDLDGSAWSVDARLTYGLFQYRNLFVDLFAGQTVESIDVQSQTTPTQGDELFYLPFVGIEMERITETSTFLASTWFETNLSNTNPNDLNNLGRAQVTEDWKVIQYNVGTSFYLEPLLFPRAWEDPATPRSSTLSHEISIGIRGQQSLDDRLPPQAMQVVGGLYSVRGYKQSVASGDSVFIASAEYRFHLPRILPIQREPLQVPLLGDFRASPQMVYGRPDWDFIIKGFIDYGRTKRVQGFVPDDPMTPLVERFPYEPDDSLLGAGAGIEFRYKHNLTVRADWGHALKSTNSRNDAGTGPRVRKGDDRLHLLFSVLY